MASATPFCFWGSSQKIYFRGIGVDKETVLKQVSLMVNEPSLTQLGSWRRTAVLHVTVATWMGNAAAVLSGTGGAVTRRAPHSGDSRTAVYLHAQRVGQAVASAQAGGPSDDVLGQANERLKAANAALWQAWSAAAECREATQRHVAGSGCAMGLRLSQSVTWCASVLPLGAVPRRAMGGRWVQAAAARAGRRLVGLDLAWRARVQVLCFDAIVLHRAPVLMAIEPNSMAWRAGQRGPDRRGESGRAVITTWPGLEHVIADGGQGRERGVQLAHAARCPQGKAAQTVSQQARTRGLAVWHPPRERARVLPRQWKHAARQRDTASQADATVGREKRQGRDPRGVSGGAGRAWRQAERRVEQAGHAQEAVPQLAAALAWLDAQGQRDCRQTAQAQLDEARQRLHGDCWSQGKRLLREERTLRHVARLRAPLTAAVSEPVWRAA
jgi:hypothetical protein